MALLATLLGWGFVAAPARAVSSATSISVGLSPTSITADGSTSTVTATVKDGANAGVVGDTVGFSSSDTGVHFGPVTGNPDGTYTATLTGSTTAGTPTITATDSSAAPSLTASATLTQTPGPATNVTVVLSPNAIIANHSSTSTATATVRDAYGNQVASGGHSITFSSNDTGIQFGPVTDNANGTYTGTLTSSTTAGTPTVTATDTTIAVFGTATLTQTPGPATSVTIAPSTASATADGTTQTPFVATVTDANGNRVANDTITASANGGATAGAVTNNHDGTYGFNIKSSTTAGNSTITATDTTTNVRGTATLNQTAGAASLVTIAFDHNPITANGSSKAQATASVTDAHGNPVTGDTVNFTATAGVTPSSGSAHANGDGTYSFQLTSSTTAAPSTITATDTTVTPNPAGQATLNQTHGPATTVSVGFDHNPIIANGSSTSQATATITDSHGNPATGDTVKFTSTGGVTPASGSAQGNPNGTYGFQLTSSTHAGPSTITVTDTTAGASSAVTLNQTAGPPAAISLTLGSPSITADGHAQTTASALVTDANGNAVAGETISLHQTGTTVSIGQVGGSNGTYTAALTSSPRHGATQLTATNAGNLTSNVGTLFQSQDVPTAIVVRVNPTSIPADGRSTSTATARLTDVHGYPVVDDSVNFSPSDPGATAGATTNNGDGTYSAPIRSSNTPGQATIRGTDTVAAISGSDTVTQTPPPSSTSLVASPSSAATNQPVTLFAAVTGGSPSGTISFAVNGTPIAGCTGKPISTSNPTASCAAAFAAAQSPAALTAVFTPDANSTVAGSTGSAALHVTQDSTTTSLGFSNASVSIGQSVTYSAFVLSSRAGSTAPTGAVQFLDHGAPINSCDSRPLFPAGGAFAATCTVNYGNVGTHAVTAVYSGDANFSGSNASPVTIPVKVLGLIVAPLRWTFASTATDTRVLALSLVSASPVGSSVLVTCHGGGCPYAKYTTAVSTAKHCLTRHGKRSCTTVNTVDLASRFAKRHLRPGTQITVDVSRYGWIGRYYTFQVRAKRAPKVITGCLAPGTTQPTSC